MDWQAILQRVEEKQADTIKLIRQLVAIDTSVPPGRNYDRIADLLEPRFARLGYQTERVVIPEERLADVPLPLEGPRVNLVASRQWGKEPLTIYAHTDTHYVMEGWTRDPFGGEIVGDRMYGLGISDQKASIATLLTTLTIIEELGVKPKFDLAVCLATDKELGFYPGIYHLALNGYVRGHILSLTGTQLPQEIIGSSGNFDTEITVKGKLASSGELSFMGINALEAAVPIMNRLLKLKQEVGKRTSSMPSVAVPGQLSPKVTPRLNLINMRADYYRYKMPDWCQIRLNRRYIPEEDYEVITNEIREAVMQGAAEGGALETEIRFYHAFPAARYDNSPQYMERIRRLRAAYKAVWGYKEEEFLQAGRGSNDMAFAVLATGGVDIIHCGLVRMDSNAHSVDESVLVSDLPAHTKTVLHYLLD
jgi:succinyl-diaminopimelate desuccinylase